MQTQAEITIVLKLYQEHTTRPHNIQYDTIGLYSVKCRLSTSIYAFLYMGILIICTTNKTKMPAITEIGKYIFRRFVINDISQNNSQQKTNQTNVMVGQVET